MFKKELTLNNFITIENWGYDANLEYNIQFTNKELFYKSIKDCTTLIYDTKDDLINLELVNIISDFIKPHLPYYTKLHLRTKYLKYQRQDRPTIDCQANLFKSYIESIKYDKIEVPFIHSNHLHEKLEYYDISHFNDKLHQDITSKFNNFIPCYPDEGAKKNLFVPIYNKENTFITFQKERVNNDVISIIPSNEIDYCKQYKKFVIIDDIIGGGLSIQNCIDKILEINPQAEFCIVCFFMMSDYGEKKLLNNSSVKDITYYHKVINHKPNV